MFLGIGAQAGERMGIPGEDLANCIKRGRFPQGGGTGRRSPRSAGRIAVVGGGFTAIDASRTALRLGAKEVYILYRRTKDEMPASAEEIAEAEEEGVRIMYLVAPQEIVGNGAVRQIRMLNYVLGEKDPSGRRRPVEVPGTEFTLDVDMVISAVSQGVLVEAGQDLALDPLGHDPRRSADRRDQHGGRLRRRRLRPRPAEHHHRRGRRQAGGGLDRPRPGRRRRPLGLRPGKDRSGQGQSSGALRQPPPPAAAGIEEGRSGQAGPQLQGICTGRSRGSRP